MSRRAGLAFLATFSLLTPLAARAQVHDWSVKPGKGNGNPTAAVTYYDRDSASKSYFAVDKTMYGVVSESGTSVGSVTTGRSVENFPSVVPLADGKRYIFIASQDGYIYKLDADTMATVAYKDMRRVACPTDSLQATPTVQLAAYSNGSFTPAADLVYVPTYHGCGDTTQNQVVALYASDLTTAWTFNLGEYEMDFIAEGCSLDYDSNRLYCGSNLSAGAYQNTVWAINTADGSLVWAGNFNSVRTRPQLSRNASNHMYIADYLGNLHAVERSTGTESWILPITTASGAGVSSYIAVNMWAEFREPYQDMIFVTDSAGVLHAVYDSGAFADAGIEVWSTSFAGGQKVQSLGSVSPSLGKLYVGLSDGTVHQLNLASGSDEANRTVNASPSLGDVVTDPTLHLNGGADISKLVVSANSALAGTVTKQFGVPWTYASTGASLQDCKTDTDCSSLSTPRNCDNNKPGEHCCAVGRCNLADGVCYAEPDNKQTGCNDGKGSCTTNKACIAGACVGDWDYGKCAGSTSNCAMDPQRGCGKGKVCVKGNDNQYTCVDPQTDADYCGGVARSCNASDPKRSGVQAWGGDRVCNKGICERKLDFCNAALPSDMFERQGNLSGLTFTRVAVPDPKNGGTVNVCHAWGSVFENYDNAKNPTIHVFERDPAKPMDPAPYELWYTNTSQTGRSVGIGTIASSNEIFQSIIDPLAATRFTADGFGLLGPFPMGQEPKPTDGGEFPFAIKAFNVGPSAPSSDDKGLAAGGRLFYGNWRANGDVWKLGRDANGSWRGDQVWSRELPAPNCPPPWCPPKAGSPCGVDVCGQQDRIVATDFFPGGLSDAMLRIAVRTEVIVFNLTTQQIMSRIDLRDGYWQKGTGGNLFNAKEIAKITSLTADPLNGNASCIVEVVDSATKYAYLVHVSNDGSMRLVTDMYKDLWQGAWPPTQNQTNPPMSPPAYFPGEGRLTSSAQTHLYRLNLVDPKAPQKNDIVRLPLPR